MAHLLAGFRVLNYCLVDVWRQKDAWKFKSVYTLYDGPSSAEGTYAGPGMRKMRPSEEPCGEKAREMRKRKRSSGLEDSKNMAPERPSFLKSDLDGAPARRTLSWAVNQSSEVIDVCDGNFFDLRSFDYGFLNLAASAIRGVNFTILP